MGIPLRANGWPLPVSIEGLSRSSRETGGGRGESLDGSERNASTGVRDVLSGRLCTNGLSLDDSAAFRGWVGGRGDRWRLTEYLDSGAGESGVGANLSYRPREGSFAAGAVAVESAGANVLTSPSEIAFGSPWSIASSSSVTVTPGQPVPGVTVNGASRVQTSGGSSTIKYQLVKSGTTGSWRAISVLIYNPPASVSTVVVQTSGLTVTGISNSISVIPGQTKRVVIVGTIPGTSTTLRFNALTAGESLDFYAYQPKIEEQASASTFGGSGIGALSLPTTCTAPEGTIAFWYTPMQAQGSVLSQLTSPAIATFNGYFAAQSWRLWAFSSGSAVPNLNFNVRGPTAAGWSSATTVVPASTPWFAPNIPVHLAVTWARGSVFSVYRNGTLAGSVTISDPFTAAMDSYVDFHGESGAQAGANGLVHEVVTAPYCMSAGQVAALAAATASMPDPPIVACDGDLLRGLTVNMTGNVSESAEITAVSPAVGSYREAVPFTLTPT